MNILHLQLSGNPGGIVCLCRDIANNSTDNNIIYFLQSGGTVADAIKADGHQVVVNKYSKNQWVKSACALDDFCKTNKVDVIINHSKSPMAIFVTSYVISRNKHIKWLMYFHSAPQDMPLKHKILYRPFIKHQIRHADARIAISEFVKGAAADFFKVKKDIIQVVYNGVDTSKFTGKDKTNEDVVKFIYVGRLFPKKGVHVLIDAICQLKDVEGFHVNIVGSGEQQEELEKMAKDNNITDKVSFLGSRLDVPDLLAASDYFVHPAIWNEGFGITLIEAMSAGLPCVAFKRGAIPEIIVDGENGYMVDEIDSHKLADAIKKCIALKQDTEYEKMSDSAIKTASKFSISNTVKELESIIERC